MPSVIKGDSNVNLDFSTGGRITGDFSNATVANRVMFQTSTTNGATGVIAIPNGTGVAAAWRLYSSSDTANASIGDIAIGPGGFEVRSFIAGTGTYMPMLFSTGGSERVRIDTSGNVGIGTSSPTWKTTVVNGSTPRCLQLSQYATNNTDKYSFISAGHYTSSTYTDGFALIGGVGSSGANAVQIGGGIGETLASSVIQFYTAANNTTTVGTERMRIDSSGNLGLGVTPSAWSGMRAMDIGDGSFSISADGAGAGDGSLTWNGYYNGSNWIYKYTGGAATRYRQNESGHAWFTAPSGTAGNAISFTQAMTLDSSGNLLVGTTSASTTAAGSYFEPSNIGYGRLNLVKAATGTTYALAFYYAGTQIGNIANSTTATAYNTSSDYRLKHDIAPMTGALEKVALLKPCTYKWNSDGSDGEGFIAHELAEVVPDAVTGEKDAVNEDGSIRPQGIDTSFLIATLTAAIQELKAIVDAQGAEIAALKGTA